MTEETLHGDPGESTTVLTPEQEEEELTAYVVAFTWAEHEMAKLGFGKYAAMKMAGESAENICPAGAAIYKKRVADSPAP